MDGPLRFLKNLSSPDEAQSFEKWSASTVKLGELVVGRVVLEPGFRWSEHVRPTAGTQSCEFRHIGVALSGQSSMLLDDGTEFDVHAGDVFDIPAGHDNWVVGDEPAVYLVWGGWRGWGKAPVGDRVLLTMLMTDIVGSTDTIAAVGDRAWDRMLEGHNREIRAVLERYRATEIDTTGDGFLATVDGAARAVQAATEIRAALRRLGLHIRVGIHTGEVEVVPGSIRGIAVHETARIMALADSDEITVSSTTMELSGGAGLRYEDRGIQHLKGIPNPRRVFAVIDVE